MIQIQQSLDIIEALIKNDDYKDVRALAAFYLRLTGTTIQIYKMLEPLYNDYSKLRIINSEASKYL